MLLLQPALGQTGSTTVTATVSDGAGGTVSKSFELTVLPVVTPPEQQRVVNLPPVAGAIQNLAVTEDQAYSFDLNPGSSVLIVTRPLGTPDRR